MNLINLIVMYGHLEGAGGNFARDPTGHLSIAAGIFEKHGLKVAWDHVQGTEERYRRLEDGSAQISLVVGHASLQHFLTSGKTRIVGCAMNSCPYYLIVSPAITSLAALKGKIVVCRDGPARDTPIAETFYERARLRVGTEVSLRLTNGDQDAFNALIAGQSQGAFLPRPFAFIAEERGFQRLTEWPDIIDDPLPITIETTVELWARREEDFRIFLTAHGEGIRYFKAHRAEALGVLKERFGHSVALAEKTFDDYVVCMDDTLQVDIKCFDKLFCQVAPESAEHARQVAAEWIIPGALK